MNTAHLHLMFIHLPIAGLVFALMINVYSIYSKSNEMKRFVLFAYLILGVFALPAYLTGDGASELIKTYSGISDSVIETHENYALMFLIGVLVLAALAGVGLYVTKTKDTLLKKIEISVLVVGLLLLALAYKTGATGGAIRHPEITSGITTVEQTK